ncbi:hybrid sensor histidine kinase/response regulator [Malikia spinosa]|uniref:hybrid sensor histidine kinase/response regulator n=1 Tax=Malikia spinosa TaxID=86180 RepID=UPI0027BB03D4|nr:PAS domain-containing hybrid sensor histidine kinase/response regulator [Malikia spinosa]
MASDLNVNYTPAIFSAQAGLISALDDIQGIIKFDINGYILEANKLFRQIMGYEIHELVGQHHRMFFDPVYASGEEYRLLWESLRAGEARAGQFHRLSKQGQTVWLQASYNPVRGSDGRIDHIVKFATDITERQNSELLLSRTKQALELANQSAQIGSWDYEVANDVVHLSPFCATLLEIDSEPPLTIGNLLARLEPREYIEQAIQQAIQSGTGWDLELLHFNLGGEPRWFRSIGRAEMSEGSCVRLAVMMQDIHSIKQRELELLHAQQMAEAAVNSKDQFLATVSHELRTPLNAILGLGQILALDNRLDGDAHDFVLEIVNAGEHLLSLVNDLLDLAKVDQQDIQVTLDAVSLGPVLQECMGLIQQAAQARGISLHVADASGYTVQADRIRLKQVLLNLMSNAVKYNRPDGKIDITIDRVPTGYVRLEVRDTGLGIAQEHLSGLFKPFNRLGAENSTVEGTGIGLNIAQKLVRKMGGTIGVESQVNVGSIFWVEFPLAIQEPAVAQGDAFLSRVDSVAPAAVAAPAMPAAGLATAGEPDRRLILVAEDNPVNRKVIGLQLKRLGYAHDFAEDGEAALFRWREQAYDLVLTDLQMPRMGGYELAQQIRSEEKVGQSVPIIVFSANAMDAAWTGWRLLGVNDFLTKPVKFELLGEKLAYWLSSIPHSDAASTAQTGFGGMAVPAMLDLAVLADLVGSDPGTIREFLQHYQDSAEGLAAQLQTAFVQADWLQLARFAHSLKSSSRSVGAMALGQVCEQLEQAGTREQAAELSYLMPLFDSVWKRLCQAMATALSDQTADSGAFAGPYPFHESDGQLID